MSWTDAFAAERDAAARGPKAANPATIGEIWDASWQAAGLDTTFGVGAPWADAQADLRREVETVSGMSAADLARSQGKRLTALDWSGASEEAKARELADLAAGLSSEQQDKLKPFLDVPARAREKAAARERQAADVADRTYGLSGHAVGFLAGMTRQGLDPVNAGTMFVGGPLRGPVLKMLGREFAYGAGVQALQEPFIEAGRAELGLEAGMGRALGNIFEAGLGNAGLAGLFRGGAWLLRGGRPLADAVTARPGEAAPAPAAESRLGGDLRESAGEGAPLRPGIDSPAGERPLAAAPAGLRDLVPEDFDAAARLAERDQLVDDLAPEPSSLGKALHGEAVDAAIARLESAGSEAMTRFDQVLADLDRRLEAGSRPADGTPADASAPAAPNRRKRVREPKPVSLGRFIAQQGGIRIDEGGDLRHLGINQMFVPGVGMVGRVNGRQLDRDLEPLLIAEGYLRPQDPNAPPRDIREEVYDALREEFVGKRPRFAQKDEARVADLATDREMAMDQRWRDEIAAEADAIRARLTEVGIDPQSHHPQDIAEAAELLVSGSETSWDAALERVAIRKLMGDNPELPALAEIADDIPPGWEIDNEVPGAAASANRRAAGEDGQEPSRQADRGGPAAAGRDVPQPGEAGAGQGRAAGNPTLEADPALASLGRLAAALPDPAGYRARLADLERTLRDDPDFTVALDSGDVSARKLIEDIAADADAADALKACLGQTGGDA